MALSCQIDWCAAWPPSSTLELRECDLTLNSTRGQPWLWPLPNKKYIYNSTRLNGILRWCSNFGSAATLGGVMSQKPNLDLWLIDLTSEVTSWPETFLDLRNLGPVIWAPIAASLDGRHAGFFRESLAKLRGLPMYKTVTSGERRAIEYAVPRCRTALLGPELCDNL